MRAISNKRVQFRPAFRQCLFMVLLALCIFSPAQAVHVGLVINEIDVDTPGVDSAEFIELYYSGTGAAIDLTGYRIVLWNGSSDTIYAEFALTGIIAPDEYLVLCGNNTNVANCDMDVLPDTNLIQNGADAVALYDTTASVLTDPADTTGLIDAIVYDTDDSDDAGLLVLLNPGQPQVNERGRGDSPAHSNQRISNGTGGQRNTSSYDQALPTPGEPNNICGDGTILAGEGCDDGNLVASDGCLDTCTIEDGWLCTGEPSVCGLCGDGNVVAGLEECDDGNNTIDDGCSDICTIEDGWSCSEEPSICSMEVAVFPWEMFLPAITKKEKHEQK